VKINFNERFIFISETFSFVKEINCKNIIQKSIQKVNEKEINNLKSHELESLPEIIQTQRSKKIEL